MQKGSVMTCQLHRMFLEMAHQIPEISIVSDSQRVVTYFFRDQISGLPVITGQILKPRFLENMNIFWFDFFIKCREIFCQTL